MLHASRVLARVRAGEEKGGGNMHFGCKVSVQTIWILALSLAETAVLSRLFHITFPAAKKRPNLSHKSQAPCTRRLLVPIYRLRKGRQCLFPKKKNPQFPASDPISQNPLSRFIIATGINFYLSETKLSPYHGVES